MYCMSFNFGWWSLLPWEQLSLNKWPSIFEGIFDFLMHNVQHFSSLTLNNYYFHFSINNIASRIYWKALFYLFEGIKSPFHIKMKTAYELKIES